MNRYLLTALGLILVTSLICMPFQASIVIADGKTGKILAHFPIDRANPTFHIQYTHSIHLSDVKESYRVFKDGTIRQYELMYDDMAVGMPSHAEKGETFSSENGHYYIRGMKRDFPSIYMRVGQVVANHQLIVGGSQTEFSQFVEKGALVKIEARRLSILQLLKGVKISVKEN